MPDFRYTDPFALEGADSTRYHALGSEHVTVQRVGDQEVVRVAPQAALAVKVNGREAAVPLMDSTP